MILREIKNIYIKNRLTEGVDFKRYEWLKGRNGAYINTNYYPIVGTDVFSVHFAYDGTIKNPDGVEQCIFGTMSSYNYIRAYISSSGTLSCNYFYNKKLTGFPSTQVISNECEINDLMLNGSNYQFTANGVTYSFSNNDIQSQVLSTPILVFKSVQVINSNCYFHGDIASFKITDTSFNTKMDLIPCQLLKPIPASLDANNIARSAGECGMYDSISGKFYGNVASTGTFTVEGDVEPETHTGLQQIYQNRLIEGVDYETADWLKADIPKGTTMMRLPINSSNIEFDIERLSLGNIQVFTTENASYFFWQNSFVIGVFDTINLKDFTSKQYPNNITLFHVRTTETSVKFNNIEIGVYGFPIEYFRISCIGESHDDGITKTSSIKVDGVTRYVPCTLLRSIPRNLDAQCKERQAGECGMIDLISGKFYGNVASSGTFTVENDNN